MEAADGTIKDPLNTLTMGIMRYLRRHPNVQDIKLTDKQPAASHQLLSWEQHNGCEMPEDMKNFYRTSDGLKLEWNVSLDGQTIPIGHFEVNAIGKVAKLPLTGNQSGFSLEDVADSDCEDEVCDTAGGPRVIPRLNQDWKHLELDSCQGVCKILLVYRVESDKSPSLNPSLWIMDRALNFHFLADTFSEYYRLALAYLGLPQWPLALTSIGVPSPARQWMHLFIPQRISGLQAFDKPEPPRAVLDINRVFKGKVNPKKPAQSSSTVTATTTQRGGKRAWQQPRNQRPALNSR